MLFAYPVVAATSITSSTVSGHWQLSDSPILIFNDITVPHTQTLQIDAGVDIIFQGSYKLTISGTLFSVGTAAQPITYHRNDTTGWADTAITTGGWQGILFEPTSADLSIFRYSNVYDMKHGTLDDFRPINIANCNFFHNKNGCMRIDGADLNQLVDIGFCTFHDNPGKTLVSSRSCKYYIHEGAFYNNTAHCLYNDSASNNVLFQANDVYNNTQSDTIAGGLLKLQFSRGAVANNKIHSNTSLLNAVVACYASEVSLDANIICNNVTIVPERPGTNSKSIQGGAAIRIDDSGATVYRTSIITNNIIANNSTAYCGAAVYLYGANAGIFNNTIMNNSAAKGGCIYIFDSVSVGGTSVKVKNNILYHNVDTGGGAIDTLSIYVASADTLRYEYNFSSKAFSSDHIALTTFTLTGDTLSDVIYPSPLLINPTHTTSITENALSANFEPLINSPCVNTGDTTGTSTTINDYAGNLRVSGTVIDIGAIETPYKLSVGHHLPGTYFTVYPNPAQHVVHCLLPAASGTLAITDIMGKIMDQQAVNSATPQFNLDCLARGIYVIVWKNSLNNSTAAVKLVVE